MRDKIGLKPSAGSEAIRKTDVPFCHFIRTDQPIQPFTDFAIRQGNFQVKHPCRMPETTQVILHKKRYPPDHPYHLVDLNTGIFFKLHDRQQFTVLNEKLVQ